MAVRVLMRAEIRRIQRELGVTTILVTHDQTEATTMADRVVVMNGGRVEQEGAADDLYERPDTLFVASFIGSPPINLFEGEADAGVVKFHEASIALAESVRGGRRIGWIDPRRPRGDSVRGRGQDEAERHGESRCDELPEVGALTARDRRVGCSDLLEREHQLVGHP